MTFASAAVFCWLLLAAVLLWAALTVASIRGWLDRRANVDHINGPFPPLQVVIPVKGLLDSHRPALSSFLSQTYPTYSVTFVMESADDPCLSLVEELCAVHGHASRVISGTGGPAAQKNLNLNAGIHNLKPETEIVVFCDSTNVADPDWLMRFTAPLRKGTAGAVSTFRCFVPDPPTIAGGCQSVYGAVVFMLAMVRPKPWGGATGIRRDILARLDVERAWSNTIVDDLVLGNLLDKAGIPVIMQRSETLSTPLANQTISGFLSYLDRQIMFPKYTNPVIWMQTLLLQVSVTLGMVMSIGAVLAAPFSLVTPVVGLASAANLAQLTVFMLLLRRFSRTTVSLSLWLKAVLPFALLASFVFMRSIFRGFIDWHGKRYWPGKGGVVLRVESAERSVKQRSRW